ncbi:hypothetical protein GCM10011379_30020 [Filimonas zeae]|uniref:Chaperone of endosialidase n=2 Tax=Filimonas zeae TaxID=1737353 RepID=A0A917IZE5_9BACT|nr:hypothetical protein GCM10011379_30020 [Filimonas zeae]
MYSYGSSGVVLGTTTNHPLSLFANNTASVVLLPNGNIGMGSGSPIYKLHLYSAGNTNTTAAFLAGEYYGPSFGVKGNSPSYYALNVVNNVTAPEVSGAGANSLLYVRADGNVGVGTNAPAYKLDVNGTISSSNAAGASPYIIRNTSNLNRWSLGISNSETGTGNTGFDFRVVRWTDAGTALGAPLFIRRSNGFIGLNNENPQSQLDVNGNAMIRGEIVSNISDPNTGGRIELRNPAKTENGAASRWVIFNMAGAYGNSLQFWSYDNLGCTTGGMCANRVTFKDDGNVGIGTMTPVYKLDVRGTGAFSGKVTIGETNAQSDLNVNGNIKTRKITVTQTNWPDYVFDSSYQLKPLHQVAQYIQQNKHLPDVPSAEAVNKNGVDIGDNQALLLKKIEELTLYIIQQNKDMQEMKDRIKVLEAKK